MLRTVTGAANGVQLGPCELYSTSRGAMLSMAQAAEESTIDNNLVRCCAPQRVHSEGAVAPRPGLRFSSTVKHWSRRAGMQLHSLVQQVLFSTRLGSPCMVHCLILS